MSRPVLVVEGDAGSEALKVYLGNRRQDSTPCIVECSRGPEDSSDSTLWERLSEVVSEVIREGASRVSGGVEVHLVSPVVQVRRLRDLPPVSSRDLVKLVRGQRERFFRRVDEEVVISAKWAEDASDSKVARSAMVEASLLEAVESGAREAGMRVDAFLAVPSHGSEPINGLELRTPGIARRRMVRRIRHAVALLIVMTSGWAFAGALYVTDLVRDARFLEDELTRMQTTLSRVDSIERRLAEFAPVAETFTRQSAEAAWASRQLADLARGLPGGPHLHSINMGRTGYSVIQVHGVEPTSLVDSLEGAFEESVTLLDSHATGDSADVLTARLEVAR